MQLFGCCRRERHPDMILYDVSEETRKPHDWVGMGVGIFLMTVTLSCAFGLGFGLGYRGRSNGGNDEPTIATVVTAENKTTGDLPWAQGGGPPCFVSNVYDQCKGYSSIMLSRSSDTSRGPVGGSPPSANDVPTCLIAPYKHLRETWIPSIDPSFSHRFTSCHPANLALLTVASELVTRQVNDPLALYALTTLFFSTNGVDWFNQNKWISRFPICQWNNVACDDQENVVGLQLSSNYLDGTLPSELSLLSTLRVVNLAENNIRGPLLPRLVNITEFRIGNNQLSGQIPLKFWDQSRKLRVLDLSSNQLTGELSGTLGFASKLKKLRLNNNQLSGPIPVHAGRLKKMLVLDLSDNQLNGPIPSTMGRLKRLTILNLQRNQLTGELPTSLGKLKEATSLLIQSNNFTGVIPNEICQLWDVGSLQQFGGEEGSLCKEDTYGYAKCPDRLCCRNCPTLSD